jgi:hypothetical protein
VRPRQEVIARRKTLLHRSYGLTEREHADTPRNLIDHDPRPCSRQACKEALRRRSLARACASTCGHKEQTEKEQVN